MLFPPTLQTTCADGSTVLGRKRRAADDKQEENTGFEDIAVGSTISITTEEVVIQSRFYLTLQPVLSKHLRDNQNLFLLNTAMSMCLPVLRPEHMLA